MTIVSQTVTAGDSYNRAISAPNGLFFTAVDLPDGLTLGQNGVISGILIQPGRFTITILVRGVGGTSAAVLDLTVVTPPTPFITSPDTMTHEMGTSFSYQITANSPTAILSYNATNLPTGLTVNTSSGLISGTPTSASNDPVETTTVVLSATNAAGTGSQNLILTIQQRPVITSSLTALTFPQGTAISPYTITASKSPLSFGASPLPAGLTVNLEAGIISGTPVLNGNFVPAAVPIDFATIPDRITPVGYGDSLCLTKSLTSDVLYEIRGTTQGNAPIPYAIAKIDSFGVVTNFFSSRSPAQIINGRTPAAVDSLGNVYVCSPGGKYDGGTILAQAGVTKIPFNTVGTAALFNTPRGITVNTSGQIFVADSSNNTIRKIVGNNNTNVTTTYAGTAPLLGSTDGAGSSARFSSPYGVAVDASGNVYVADTNNHTIRKITLADAVTTLAGTPLAAGSSDGTGSSALFYAPKDVAVDASGNVYVADTNNSTIRKITSAGVVTTLAGTPLAAGSTDGTGASARFNYPGSVAVDASGNVYVADTNNHTIRKITSAGVVTTLAGTPLAPGSTNGTGASARFNFPGGVAVDASGNVYVADTNNSTIRKITSAGVVTTLAGVALQKGTTDAAGASARFNLPFSVDVDASGNVYVADSSNQTIRKITSAGVVTTLAGFSTCPGSSDGDALFIPGPFYRSLCFDLSDNMYSAFPNPAAPPFVQEGIYNNLIKQTPNRDIFTYDFTNNVFVPFTGSFITGSIASQDGGFTSIAAGFSGDIYVDSGRTYLHQIIKFPTSGARITLFYSQTLYNSNGAGFPNLYVSSLENIYFSESTTVYMLTPGANVAQSPTSPIGSGAAYRIVLYGNSSVNVEGLVLDSSENIYSTVTSVIGGINTVRVAKTPRVFSGAVTTFAGTAGSAAFVNGTGSSARFSSPQGLKLSSSGDLYVADTGNNAIRKITSAGVVSTLATGIPSPIYLTVAPSGNVYVTDSANHVIRKITPAGIVSIHAGTVGVAGVISSPGGVTVRVEADSSETIFVKCSGPAGMVRIFQVDPPPPDTRIAVVNSNMYFNSSLYAPSDLISLGGNSFLVNLTTTDQAQTSTRAIRQWSTTVFGSELQGSVPSTPTVIGALGFVGAGVSHLAVSPDGGLYHTNSLYNAVSETPTLSNILLQPIANRAGARGSANGLGNVASFNNPTGIAASSNFIYVSDTGNHTIRRIARAANPVVTNSLLTANNGVLTGSAALNITVTG
jgi:sugar lactone lactonase YvrE